MPAPQHGPRQRHARGVAGARFALHLRPAGIGEAEQLRHLVEGLADGVVDGGAEPLVMADAEHRDDLGVAAGGEEQAIGKRRGVGEPRGQRVRLEMVDRHQRLAGDQRDRLGGGQPHDHAADQAGPGGGGDAVEIGEAHARLLHRLRDDQVERLDVGARGDLRHHAAERRVLLDLRQHDVGADAAGPGHRPLDHRRRGLVAGRLDAEHDHRGFISRCGVRVWRTPCHKLGVLPPPLAGEGWGGGRLARIFARAPTLSLQPKSDVSDFGQSM